MKKIGILTYHRSVNEGAIMQAYCVNKILKTNFPDSRIEIIDVRSKNMELREWKKLVRLRRLSVDMKALRKYINLRSFLHNHGVMFSPSRVVTDSTARATQFINRQGYDLVVVGSDTVWEIRPKNLVNTTVAPNIYFLKDISTVRKLAFAVSADPVNGNIKEFMSQRDIISIREAVSNFDQVLVRDSATLELLASQLKVRDGIKSTIDPTLLVDFSELKSREKIIVKSGMKVGLALSSFDLKKGISNRIKSSRTCDFYNFLGINSNNHTSMTQLSLGDKLMALSELDILITDRFHSSIFALKLGSTPVIFIEDSRKWDNSNSKGRDLFQRLGFEKYVLRSGSNGDVDYDQILDLMHQWQSDSDEIAERVASLIRAEEHKLRLVFSNFKEE